MQTSGLDEALAQVRSEEGKGKVEEELLEDTGDNVGIDLGQVWLLTFGREKKERERRGKGLLSELLLLCSDRQERKEEKEEDKGEGGGG